MTSERVDLCANYVFARNSNRITKSRMASGTDQSAIGGVPLCRSGHTFSSWRFLASQSRPTDARAFSCALLFHDPRILRRNGFRMADREQCVRYERSMKRRNAGPSERVRATDNLRWTWYVAVASIKRAKMKAPVATRAVMAAAPVLPLAGNQIEATTLRTEQYRRHSSAPHSFREAEESSILQYWNERHERIDRRWPRILRFRSASLSQSRLAEILGNHLCHLVLFRRDRPVAVHLASDSDPQCFREILSHERLRYAAGGPQRRGPIWHPISKRFA